MFACVFFLIMTCFFLGPGKLMSAALISMRFCGGSKSSLARTKWASDHQLYKYGRSMYSGARNEKRTEPFVMFKKLIRPLFKGMYKFACKKHSNVEEKSLLTTTTIVEGNDDFCLKRWRGHSVDSSFFFGVKGMFFPPAPSVVRKGIPPEKDAWTCKRGVCQQVGITYTPLVFGQVLLGQYGTLECYRILES